MVRHPISCLPAVIPIGVQTEADVMEVRFDCSAWLEAWPDMKLSVWPTRPGENAAYQAQSHMEGSALVWKVSAYDTEKTGNGRVEIFGFSEDGKRKLTGDGCHTSIRATTMATTKEPGEAEKPWVEDVLNAADRAEAAASKVEDMLTIGIEHAGKLLHVGDNGELRPLALGDGLEIIDGVLRLTGNVTPPEPDEPTPPQNEMVFTDMGSGVVLLGGVELTDQGDGVVLIK